MFKFEDFVKRTTTDTELDFLHDSFYTVNKELRPVIRVFGDCFRPLSQNWWQPSAKTNVFLTSRYQPRIRFETGSAGMLLATAGVVISNDFGCFRWQIRRRDCHFGWRLRKRKSFYFFLWKVKKTSKTFYFLKTFFIFFKVKKWKSFLTKSEKIVTFSNKKLFF